jgi:hypothetical protein
MAKKPAAKPAPKKGDTESHTYNFRTRNQLLRGPKPKKAADC